MTVIVVTPAATLDDVDVRSDNNSFQNNTSIQLTKFSFDVHASHRFVLAIPPGSTINDATITTTDVSGTSVGNMQVDLAAENALDPGQYISPPGVDFNTRRFNLFSFRGTGSYGTGIPGLQRVFQLKNAPATGNVIQQVIDQPGWVSGNHINIFFTVKPVSQNGKVNQIGAVAGLQPPAFLTVDFTEPIAGGAASYSSGVQQSYSQLII